jgi:hypothetical protein
MSLPDVFMSSLIGEGQPSALTLSSSPLLRS